MAEDSSEQCSLEIGDWLKSTLEARKYQGFSNVGYEEEAMSLFLKIEKKWREVALKEGLEAEKSRLMIQQKDLVWQAIRARSRGWECRGVETLSSFFVELFLGT